MSFSASITGCRSHFFHQATHEDATLNPPQHTQINKAQMALGRDRENLAVCAHFIIWGKLLDTRVQSFDTSDRCAFEQVSKIAGTLLLLISARIAVKKGSGDYRKGNFWWLEQTWLAQ